MVIHWNISIYLHKGILYKIHFLTKKVLKNIIEHFIYISFSLIYEPTLWVSVLHKFFLSVSHFSHSVVSSFLRPHGPQHARPPCPLPAPGVYSNSCLLSHWCHPTISFCRPLLLLPSILPSIRVFANESIFCIR